MSPGAALAAGLAAVLDTVAGTDLAAGLGYGPGVDIALDFIAAAASAWAAWLAIRNPP